MATAIVTFILAVLTGIIEVARRDWFGSGDIPSFIVATLPFAAFAPVVGLGLTSLTRGAPTWLSVVIAWIGGLVYGLLGTMGFGLFLGPWAGAMSVPLVQTWSMAAAVALASTALFRRAGDRRATVGFVSIVIISAIAVVGFQPVLALALGNQRLDVITIHAHRSNGSRDLPWELEAADLKILEEAGLSGSFEAEVQATVSHRLAWPRAKALIVLTGPIQADVSIAQPKGCTIVYLQEGGTFRRVPADAPTISRQIHIKRDPSGPWFLNVEHFSGGVSGSSIRE